MSQVLRTQLSCPRCGQPFTGIVEQIVDVGADPQAKARFLSGRINQVTCPNCGNSVAIGTPLLYHDPSKDLLIIYVPMEINVPPQERERIIGDLTRRLTESIPPENRRAYLLTPAQALTIPGMIDMILDKDGITAEMREAQREKMRVMEMFLQVHPEQWPNVLAEHSDMVDEEFLQLALLTAENASETGRRDMAQALVVLYQFLVQNTEFGQEALRQAQTQETVIREVAAQLEELGDDMTREDFLDLVIGFAGDDERLRAVVGLMRPAMDYQFFQQLTNLVVQQEDEAEREKLTHLREQLLELAAVVDQQTQEVLKRATDTLRLILNSEDLDAAIRPRLDLIDDTFLAVLQANIHAAEQRQDLETGDRLKQVLEATLSILRENAPPQIHFINSVMSTQSDDEAHAMIQAQAPQFGPELIDLMEAIAADLDENDQPDSAGRLRALSEYAAEYVGASSDM